MAAGADPVQFSPYDVEIAADPYPVFRRLRDEAPLYYNEEHEFYALSRYDDVLEALHAPQTYSSSRGGILELVQANVPIPPGTFIFEDPPAHTAHRGLMSRVFTPRRMNALEPEVRAFCERTLDPLVGQDRFDLIAHLAADMPMRVIGMLLGIPEEYFEAVREGADDWFDTEPGGKMDVEEAPVMDIAILSDYLDWRIKNPSDDLTTVLLQTEFEDDTGKRRTLTRDEALPYLNLLAGAGNETTTRLIGWIGKVLSEHPEQRRELAADLSLVPNAVEEVLRYEAPGPFMARYLLDDVEIHGQTMPAGSAVLLIVAAANRDERQFPDPDRFDIHRQTGGHLTLGHGIHFCLGASLARLEGRVALEEVLKRFPNWVADLDNATFGSTSTVRGWKSLPIDIVA